MQSEEEWKKYRCKECSKVSKENEFEIHYSTIITYIGKIDHIEEAEEVDAFYRVHSIVCPHCGTILWENNMESDGDIEDLRMISNIFEEQPGYWEPA